MIPPFFFRKNFSKREILSKTVGFIYKNFRQVETKNFRQKIKIPPIMIKFFDIPNFLKPWRDAQELFRYCETKFFWRKVVIPLSCIKFSIPEIFWNIEGMPTNFFGTLRPKNFETKTWYPLLFSDTTNFLKHCRDARDFFRSVRPKFSDGKIWYSPFSYVKTFRNVNFSQK